MMEFLAILLIGVIITIPLMIGLSKQNKESEKARMTTLANELKEQKFNVQVQYSFDFINDESVNEITNSAKVLLDTESKRICIVHRIREDFGKDHYTYIDFDEITDCQVKEDSEVMGGVGRAIVGGVMAGGVGAVVGSTTAKKHITNYQIVILRSNILNPQLIIPLITSKTKTSANNYKKAVEFAQNVYASVMAIIANNKK